jgi:hypothetical protein
MTGKAAERSCVGGGKRAPGRRRAIVLLAVLLLVLVTVVVWVVPRRAVDAHGVVYSSSVQSALGADIKSGATGREFTGADGWAAFGALPNGDGLGVYVYQYTNGFQRRVLAALMHPSRNSIAWDEPDKWTPPADAAWALPMHADLVGTMCGTGSCERWLIWWPYRDAVAIVDFRPLEPVGAKDAVDVMRPAIEGLRAALS